MSVCSRTGVHVCDSTHNLYNLTKYNSKQDTVTCLHRYTKGDIVMNIEKKVWCGRWLVCE